MFTLHWFRQLAVNFAIAFISIRRDFRISDCDLRLALVVRNNSLEKVLCKVKEQKGTYCWKNIDSLQLIRATENMVEKHDRCRCRGRHGTLIKKNY